VLNKTTPFFLDHVVILADVLLNFNQILWLNPGVVTIYRHKSGRFAVSDHARNTSKQAGTRQPFLKKTPNLHACKF
jgi:hypothetical protein